ncbi:MAG: HNH endonuclease [Planctomycetia bacterium]|nr:HNH endonuclease [Planctomycetia bacterium]
MAEDVYGTLWQNIVADGQVTDRERQQAAALAHSLQLSAERTGAIEQKAKEERYRRAVGAALADGEISATEASDLQQLRRTLQLSSTRAATATSDLCHDAYQALFRQVASDGRITPEEFAELQRYQAALGLSADHANSIIRDDALNLYRKWFCNIMQDGEVTAEEENALAWLEKQFGLHALDTHGYQAELQAAKRMAEIRHGKLPSVQTSKLLEGGEICHWVGPCRFQWETAAAQKEAGGELLVSSNRLMFNSATKNVSFTPAKIVDIRIFSNALQIQTDISKGTGTYYVEHPRELEAILIGLVRKHKYLQSENYSSSKSRHIPDEVRRKVWDRDGGRCVRCSACDYLEFDHLIPHAKGGANTVGNVQLLCRRCNSLKSDRI